MFWQILSITIQGALALTVIGFLLRARRTLPVDPALSHSQQPAPAADQNTAEMLAVVSRVLSEHADELGLFERSLQAESTTPDSRPADLEHQIRRVRSANQMVDQTVDDTLENLVAACGDALASEQAHLQTYQTQTRHFDHTLEAIDREALLAGIAARLLDMVQDLSAENKAVREEVVAARDRAIELTAQAHAAEQLARVDALTQLPNRRAFNEAYAEVEDAFQRTGQPYALVIVDVDHFKVVNDRHGHSAGDAVLSMIGRVLLENRRPNEHVSRLGGEEFALLLSKCDAETARILADRYRQKISSARLRYNGQYLSVTVSCGVAAATRNDTKQSLLHRADSAMYAAKASGRNQVCVDDESTQGATSAAFEPIGTGAGPDPHWPPVASASSRFECT